MPREPQFFDWLSFGKILGRNLLVAAGILAAVALAFVGGRLAERGVFRSSPAQLGLGVKALQTGDDRSALSLLKPLADTGNPQAQYWLADLYENGLGVDRDMITAVSLLERSAQQGFVPAERRLGELYLNGDETLQDFGKAASWLHKAAAAGDGGAQRDLGRIYALGLGVPRDPAEAYAWYETAAVDGDRLASRRRDDLVTRMSPDDIARGQDLAKTIAADASRAKA